MKQFVNGGITLGGRLLLAQILVAVISGPAGVASAQTQRSGPTFEESMRLGRKPPPEDDVSGRRDSLDRAFPRGKPSVSSPWLEREMRDFTELLKSGKYDIMVAPIRSEGYALDRISRSLILKSLSRELAARKLRVPNPDALSRALGDGRRTIETGEAVVFARPLGIEKLVIVGVGHARAGHLRASVGVLPVKGFESRSEEHTSELQSLTNLVCRLLLEKKKKKNNKKNKRQNMN